MKKTKAAAGFAILLGVASLAGTQSMAAPAGPPARGAPPGMDERSACSLASLEGAFGISGTGLVEGVGSAVRVGREVFDGRGHASGVASTSLNGAILRSTFTATYKVNPDCTGTVTEVDSMLGTTVCEIVIVDGGREVQVINATPGATMTATWKKQSSHR